MRTREQIKKDNRASYLRHTAKRLAGRKKYYEEHKEAVLQNKKDYYWANIDLIREKQKEYYQKNKSVLGAKRVKYQKNRRKIDPKFRVDCNMRSLVRHSLKGRKNGWKWEKWVGYTLNDLVEHLEALFDDKMNWDNYGSYWHIDHIKPRSLFSLEEFKECWALSNLQPLEKIANIKKGNKF